MGNSRQIFIDILKEIALEENISINFISQNWIIRIEKNNVSNFIYGYTFGLNSDSSSRICRDKAATSELLTLQNISNVSHFFFHNYEDYYSEKGNWKKLTDLLDTYKVLVLKPNEGTSGLDVYKVSSIRELELKYFFLSKKSTVVVSPFEEIKTEYRVVMLDNVIKLIFSKNINEVVGDGKRTLFELITNDAKSNSFTFLQDFTETQLQKIINKDERIKIGWQHNLGKGAKGDIVKDLDKDLFKSLSELASKGIKALNLRFCSVDIILNEKNEFKIIEINSGVSMIKFAAINAEYYEIAKSIYRDSLLLMLQK